MYLENRKIVELFFSFLFYVVDPHAIFVLEINEELSQSLLSTIVAKISLVSSFLFQALRYYP